MESRRHRDDRRDGAANCRHLLRQPRSSPEGGGSASFVGAAPEPTLVWYQLVSPLDASVDSKMTVARSHSNAADELLFWFSGSVRVNVAGMVGRSDGRPIEGVTTGKSCGKVS